MAVHEMIGTVGDRISGLRSEGVTGRVGSAAGLAGERRGGAVSRGERFSCGVDRMAMTQNIVAP